MRTKIRLGLLLVSVVALPVSTVAAKVPEGGTLNPYFCGRYTMPRAFGNLLVGAGKGAKPSWKNKHGACKWAKKQMKHAYWKRGEFLITGWKCRNRFGTATCTRSKLEILYVYQ